MTKGDPTNPKVGDKFYYIPPGALFIVPVEVTEIYTQDNWTIECAWIDEPVGHAIYEVGELYKTLAGAKSGLRSWKRYWDREQYMPRGWKPCTSLKRWREGAYKGLIPKDKQDDPKNWKALRDQFSKPKKIWK